jgi:hypothetical protein
MPSTPRETVRAAPLGVVCHHMRIESCYGAAYMVLVDFAHMKTHRKHQPSQLAPGCVVVSRPHHVLVEGAPEGVGEAARQGAAQPGQQHIRGGEGGGGAGNCQSGNVEATQLHCSSSTPAVPYPVEQLYIMLGGTSTVPSCWLPVSSP